MDFKFESKPFHQAQDFIEILYLVLLNKKETKDIGHVIVTDESNNLLYENLRPYIIIEGKSVQVDRGYVIKPSFLKTIKDIGIKNITNCYYIPETDKTKLRIDYSNYEKGY